MNDEIRFSGEGVFEVFLHEGQSMTGRLIGTGFDDTGSAVLKLELRGGSVALIPLVKVKFPTRRLSALELLGWAAG